MDILGALPARPSTFLHPGNAATLKTLSSGRWIRPRRQITPNFTRGNQCPVTGTAASPLPRHKIQDVRGLRRGCGLSATSYIPPPQLFQAAREQYDQLYGADALNICTSSGELYNRRRHVVYVGANDGMLHAFNAGDYIAGDDTSTPDTEHGRFIPDPTTERRLDVLPTPTYRGRTVGLHPLRQSAASEVAYQPELQSCLLQ